MHALRQAFLQVLHQVNIHNGSPSAHMFHDCANALCSCTKPWHVGWVRHMSRRLAKPAWLMVPGQNYWYANQ